MRRWLIAGVAGFLVVLAVPTVIDAWQVNRAGMLLNQALVTGSGAAAADAAGGAAGSGGATVAAGVNYVLTPEVEALLERSMALMESAASRGPHTPGREVPIWRTYGAAARMLPSDRAFELLLRSRNAGRVDWYGELWLGEVASATGHWEEAAAAYRRVDVSNLLVHRAETHIKSGKKELALRELLLAKASLEAVAEREKAKRLLMDRIGSRPSALAGMLQRPAERATTLSRIGQGLLALGQPAEARPVLEQGLALAEASSPGLIVERNLRFDLAAVLMRTLPEAPTSTIPGPDHLYFPSSTGLSRVTEAVRIRALVYQALALERSAGTCARAGRILMQMGDEVQGLALLTESIQLDPLLPDGYLGVGEWYDSHQLGYLARALYASAAELMPDDPFIAGALAVSTFKTVSHQKALPLLERAAGMDGTNPYVHAYLGDCYKELGRSEDARAAWEEGLRRFPGIRALAARLATLEPASDGSP